MPVLRPFALLPAAAVLAGLIVSAALPAAAAAPAGTTAAADGRINPAERGSGLAVAIGGGLKAEHDAVWQALVRLSGGAGARWVVLGTASEEPMASAAGAVAQLNRRGAQAVALPVSPLLKDRPVADAVRDEALLAQVRGATGVFFTGGSQDRITDSLQPGGQATPLLQAIWALYRRGGVVAGTSAGAAIMSSTMFRDAPSVLGVLKGQLREGAEVDRGLGFMGPALFVDQHFLKRGRLGRLLPMMVAKGYTLGIGVEEDSAVLMQRGPDGGDTLQVLGGKAVLVDLQDAQAAPRGGAFGLAGARLSLLDVGDAIDLPQRRLHPAAFKARGQRLDPAAPGYKPYYTLAPFYVDMLGDGALATAMGLLLDASYTEILGLAFDPRPAPGDALAALGFEFRLYRAADSHGWYSDAQGGEDYTVQNLRLDVTPVRMAQPMYAPWAPTAPRAPTAAAAPKTPTAR